MCCSSAKEMWDNIQQTYEGDSEFKQTKVSLKMNEYEYFLMRKNERMVQVFGRFDTLINELMHLGKVIPMSDQVTKLLRSLTLECDVFSMLIWNSGQLEGMTLAKLKNRLLTQEMELNAKKTIMESSKKKEKSVAYRGIENSDDSLSSKNEELMVLTKKLAMKFKKLRKNGKSKNSSSNKSVTKPLIC